MKIGPYEVSFIDQTRSWQDHLVIVEAGARFYAGLAGEFWNLEMDSLPTVVCLHGVVRVLADALPGFTAVGDFAGVRDYCLLHPAFFNQVLTVASFRPTMCAHRASFSVDAWARIVDLYVRMIDPPRIEGPNGQRL